MAKAKAVYVVLATSIERPTPAPYVVGVYTDPVRADDEGDRHEKEATAITYLEKATITTGRRPKPPAKAKKGR